jgi:hypothetical protein
MRAGTRVPPERPIETFFRAHASSSNGARNAEVLAEASENHADGLRS